MSNYHIKHLEEYFQVYNKSVNDPETFWGEIAEENFIWHKKWDRVLSWDFTKPEVKWFEGAKLNITENCLDRHLITRAEKTAILFEPNDPGEGAQHITYRMLYERVCRMANVLKDQGIQKGDRVCIYLPMIPEMVYSVLACARVGAVHSVVFAGFSATAISTRINDCECKMVITSDGSYRGKKTIDLKGIVDEALKDCTCVDSVLVAKRTNTEVNMVDGRDHWLAPLMNNVSPLHNAEIMDAEDPLFILYTSGSTGSPKGMLHTTAGYMVYSSYTFKNVFNYQENDIYWCTADVGWITGHSYIVYGPLANGATTLMFEGTPTYPDASRFWAVCEKHKVNQFYTAPTAIRALMGLGDELVAKHDLSDLRVLGSVGEPINPQAWNWYNEVVGKGTVPIVDTWWQTETGGHMMTPLPGATTTKPGSATVPFFGVQPVILDPQTGEEVEGPCEGVLAIKESWPSQMRTVYGDHDRFVKTYFATYKGYYFTEDGCKRDEDGYYWITGRVDDVLNVSGHRMGTAEIESALVAHKNVAEAAVVGYPHEVKGQGIYCYVTLNAGIDYSEDLRTELRTWVRQQIGPIASPDFIQWAPGLPKTRSGKIMRRILRKVAENDYNALGDISTLAEPEVVEQLIENRMIR